MTAQNCFPQPLTLCAILPRHRTSWNACFSIEMHVECLSDHTVTFSDIVFIPMDNDFITQCLSHLSCLSSFGSPHGQFWCVQLCSPCFPRLIPVVCCTLYLSLYPACGWLHWKDMIMWTHVDARQSLFYIELGLLFACKCFCTSWIHLQPSTFV